MLKTSIHSQVATTLPMIEEDKALAVYEKAVEAYTEVITQAGGVTQFNLSSIGLHETAPPVEQT